MVRASPPQSWQPSRTLTAALGRGAAPAEIKFGVKGLHAVAEVKLDVLFGSPVISQDAVVVAAYVMQGIPSGSTGPEDGLSGDSRLSDRVEQIDAHVVGGVDHVLRGGCVPRRAEREPRAERDLAHPQTAGSQVLQKHITIVNRHLS